MKREITYCPNLEALSQAAADFICRLARESIQQRDRFTMVLAGGKTPQLLYGKLAAPQFAAAMPWSATHLFWGTRGACLRMTLTAITEAHTR